MTREEKIEEILENCMKIYCVDCPYALKPCLVENLSDEEIDEMYEVMQEVQDDN